MASKPQGFDRLYILDCGNGHALEESRRWTPGVNVGKSIDISVNCYLIHHAQGYFLWDTGISDRVASLPNGWLPTNNAAIDIRWTRAKTLVLHLMQSIFRSAAGRQQAYAERKRDRSRAGDLKMYWTKPLQAPCPMGFV
jgi:N-acyl homoserine lactone hydrolase